MSTALYVLAALMLAGGLWAVTQSPSGTQWPIPIAVGGFVLLCVLMR